MLAKLNVMMDGVAGEAHLLQFPWVSLPHQSVLPDEKGALYADHVKITSQLKATLIHLYQWGATTLCVQCSETGGTPLP